MQTVGKLKYETKLMDLFGEFLGHTCRGMNVPKII